LLAGFPFGFEHSSDFLAGVLGVPFVDDVEERGEVAVLLIGAVNAVVDSDEANACLREHDLGIVPDFQIIPTQSRHILDDDCSHHARFHIRNHSIEDRSVEGGTADTIIHLEAEVTKTIVLGVLLQNCFLVDNTVAVTGKLIIAG